MYRLFGLKTVGLRWRRAELLWGEEFKFIDFRHKVAREWTTHARGLLFSSSVLVLSVVSEWSSSLTVRQRLAVDWCVHPVDNVCLTWKTFQCPPWSSSWFCRSLALVSPVNCGVTSSAPVALIGRRCGTPVVLLKPRSGLQSGTAKMRTMKIMADTAATSIASPTFNHRRPSNLQQHTLRPSLNWPALDRVRSYCSFSVPLKRLNGRTLG